MAVRHTDPGRRTNPVTLTALPFGTPANVKNPKRIHEFILDDTFNWLQDLDPRSVHAVITDPPFALLSSPPNNCGNAGTAPAVRGGGCLPLTDAVIYRAPRTRQGGHAHVLRSPVRIAVAGLRARHPRFSHDETTSLPTWYPSRSLIREVHTR